MLRHPFEQIKGKITLFVTDLFLFKNLITEIGNTLIPQIVCVQKAHYRHAGLMTSRHYAPISAYKSNISMTTVIASNPLFPALVPARSIACSIVSVVNSPKETGF